MYVKITFYRHEKKLITITLQKKMKKKILLSPSYRHLFYRGPLTADIKYERCVQEAVDSSMEAGGVGGGSGRGAADTPPCEYQTTLPHYTTALNYHIIIITLAYHSPLLDMSPQVLVKYPYTTWHTTRLSGHMTIVRIYPIVYCRA